MREIFGTSRIARADFFLARRDLKKRDIRAFLRDLATLAAGLVHAAAASVCEERRREKG